MKINYTLLLLLSSILYFSSCKTDEFSNTQIAFKSANYAGKVGEYDTLYTKYTYGRNTKFKLLFTVDPAVASIVFSNNEFAVIKYKTLGAGKATVQYYAKANMVSESEASIEANSSGAISSGSGKIFFKDGNSGSFYFINADGSNQSLLKNFQNVYYAAVSQDGSSIYYSNNSYYGTYNVSGATNANNQYHNSCYSLAVTADDYIVMGTDYSSATICTPSIISSKSTFTPQYYNLYTSSPSIDAGSYFLHKYNGSSAAAVYLSTCYSYNYYNYNTYYSLDYFNNGSRKNIYYGSKVVSKMKISPDGRYAGYILYDSNNGYTLNIYNLTTNASIGAIYSNSYNIKDFQFSQDGNNVVISAYSSSSSYSSYADLYVKSSTSTSSSATNITNTSSVDEVMPDWK